MPRGKKISAKPSDPTDDLQEPGFSSVEKAVEDFRAGRFVIVVDNDDRANEGDLIIAAEHATEEAIAFMLPYTRGIICVPMSAERLATPRIPQRLGAQQPPNCPPST